MGKGRGGGGGGGVCVGGRYEEGGEGGVVGEVVCLRTYPASGGTTRCRWEQSQCRGKPSGFFFGGQVFRLRTDSDPDRPCSLFAARLFTDESPFGNLAVSDDRCATMHCAPRHCSQPNTQAQLLLLDTALAGRCSSITLAARLRSLAARLRSLTLAYAG